MIIELPCATYSRGSADNFAYHMRKKAKKAFICSRIVRADGTPVYRIIEKEGIK